eukprot:80725-Amphidinium_carterae.1
MLYAHACTYIVLLAIVLPMPLNPRWEARRDMIVTLEMHGRDCHAHAVTCSSRLCGYAAIVTVA